MVKTMANPFIPTHGCWLYGVKPQYVQVKNLTEAELAEMDKIRKELGTQFCRRCNYCAPCTVGINIPSVFLFQGYLDRYGLADWAKDRYGAAGYHGQQDTGLEKI